MVFSWVCMIPTKAHRCAAAAVFSVGFPNNKKTVGQYSAAAADQTRQLSLRVNTYQRKKKSHYGLTKPRMSTRLRKGNCRAERGRSKGHCSGSHWIDQVLLEWTWVPTGISWWFLVLGTPNRMAGHIVSCEASLSLRLFSYKHGIIKVLTSLSYCEDWSRIRHNHSMSHSM